MKQPQELTEAFEVVCDELTEIFKQKHKDYGKENILSSEELGILLRTNDKVSRLKHLLMTNKDPANESIDDNWMDIAVYAIIAILYRRKWFQELEMKDK